MKNVIILAILMLYGTNVSAQYANPPTKSDKRIEFAIPVAIITTTFVLNECTMQNNGSRKQTAIIAATGIATSVITHFVIKKINKRRRNKKRF